MHLAVLLLLEDQDHLRRSQVGQVGLDYLEHPAHLVAQAILGHLVIPVNQRGQLQHNKYYELHKTKLCYKQRILCKIWVINTS